MRPKLRRFYVVFETSFCQLGKNNSIVSLDTETFFVWLLYVSILLFYVFLYELRRSAKQWFSKINKIFCTKSPTSLNTKFKKNNQIKRKAKTGSSSAAKQFGAVRIQKKSLVRIGRYLYGAYIFIASYVLFRERKRYYVMIDAWNQTVRELGKRDTDYFGKYIDIE